MTLVLIYTWFYLHSFQIANNMFITEIMFILNCTNVGILLSHICIIILCTNYHSRVLPLKKKKKK